MLVDNVDIISSKQ